MKKYLTGKNFIRVVVLLLDVVLALVIVKAYRTERRSEYSRVKKLQKEVRQEIDAALAATDSFAEDAENAAAAIPTVYSVRGDSFAASGAATGSEYPALLQSVMLEAGYQSTVLDYTIDVNGSLADLYYAGVDEEQIRGFIDTNKELDVNGSFGEVETEVGDVSALRLARNDRDAIPIIFTGYYGGWGQDPHELIEQQKAILSTYSQQEYFLIVGTHPKLCHDTAVFDDVMTDYWGSHYLNLNTKVPAYDLTTAQGHLNIANTIFNRLKTLKLCTQNLAYETEYGVDD